MKRQGEIPGRRKAAILLTILGPDAAGEVVKHFDDVEVEQLTIELARLGKVKAEHRDQIINDFHEMATAQDFISEGGVDNAKKVLEAAYGRERADDMIRKVLNAMQVQPFEFLKRADPQQLLSFIQDEHPQTIALILSYLPIGQSASVLTKLPTELRAEVAERVAMMDQTPPEVIRRVEQVLEKKVSSLLNQEMTKAGGPKQLVDLLNRVDRATERLIMESLGENNPELAESVKNMMFVFEDIVQLDDRAIQAVLKETDVKDLGMALKGVNAEVQDKIFRNMSERAVTMLKEDMEFMGPVKLRSVEEAQQKVVAAIRRLEEAGEITIGRGEEDVLV
ncbi:MAG TPA: flagellar motor switch protein FliG [Fimbriimonadaceae bacterium]|nr:flagellar motor switch protein FliG [Fimbriimonadaceae bacterium]HRJ33458.1 flagellar motor switch protein FliG [Fimbriimonadaceae bacterium]